MVIKSIGVLSVGKLMAFLYAVLGLLFGILFSLFSLVGAAIGGRDAGPIMLVFGIGAFIFFPIFYGIIGFLAGIISSALYNLVASIVGGIEVELKPNQSQP